MPSKLNGTALYESYIGIRRLRYECNNECKGHIKCQNGRVLRYNRKQQIQLYAGNKFDSKSGENKNSGAYIRKNRQR